MTPARSGTVCPVTSPSPRLVGRRSFLFAATVGAATLTAGCGAVDDLLEDESPTPEAVRPPESADERLLETALADQERVLAECLAARAAHRPLRGLLGPLVDHHRTHVEILGGRPADKRTRDVPGDKTRALQRLRDVERRAAERRAADAGKARAGELARVLAGIGASQNQHVYLVDRALADGV